MPSLIVANPGTHPELAYAAIALNESSGAFIRYLSASQVSSGHPWAYLSRLAPEEARRKLAVRVLALPPQHMKTVGLTSEVLFQLSRRFAPAISPFWLRRRNADFVRSACAVVSKLRPGDAVIAQQTVARDVFEAARCLKVLNYPIAHHRWADEYLRREAAVNPDWSFALQYQAEFADQATILDREIELADHVLVASSFVRRTFIESGVSPDRVSVVGLGGEQACESTLRSTRSEGPLRILFAGQVNQRKGIGYLLEALAALTEPFEFRVAGPISPTVRRRIINLCPLAIIEGAVNRNRMLQLYGWADVLVLPSLIEGFGLTAYEAMSVGTPAIVSDHTFAGDLIEHGENGWIIPPQSSEAIRGVLNDLAQVPDKCAIAGAAAFGTAQHRDWVHFQSEVSSLMLRLMGTP